MADVGTGVKATTGFVKNHWIAFAVTAVVIIVLALRYDRKNGGKLSVQIAKLPLVGGWFTS